MLIFKGWAAGPRDGAALALHWVLACLWAWHLYFRDSVLFADSAARFDGVGTACLLCSCRWWGIASGLAAAQGGAQFSREDLVASKRVFLSERVI